MRYLILCLMFLATPVLAEQVYCPKCKAHLYTTEYLIADAEKEHRLLSASDFIPVDGVPKPVSGMRFVCPFDGAPLNGYEYWFWAHNRQMPRMAYNALTLYVKNEKGELVWRPDEVDLHDVWDENKK